MGCFSLDPLETVLKDPLNPPDPLNPFGGSIQSDYGSSGSSTTAAAPADRNLNDEFSGILAQLPALANAQNGYLNQTLYGADGSSGLLATLQKLGPSLDQLNAGSATTQRTADLNDATSLAGGYSTLKQQLNPQLYGLLQQLQNPSALETQAGTYAQGNLGPTAGETSLASLTSQLSQPDSLESGLYDQATSLLGTNGDLTAQDLYNIQQSSRAAYAGRGMYDSNSAIGNEIMNTDAARRQRQLDNANFATGVEQLKTNRINTAGGLSTSLAASTLARQQSGLAGLVSAAGLGQNRLNTAAGLSGLLYTDPYAVIGRAPANVNTNAGVVSQTPQYLSNLLGYGSDLYNTNFNAQSAANIAAGNNAAATNAGNTQAAGSLASAGLMALMMMCWVARATYGEHDPRWLKVRRWMLTKAPAPLQGLYAAYGPQLAERVAGSTCLRAAFRRLFPRLIAGDQRAIATLTHILHIQAQF